MDLNIWVANVLASAKGRTDTAAQTIVQAVEAGHCFLGGIQLIVSWSMLSRLESALMRRGVGAVTAEAIITSIAENARLGPASSPPHIVLGGGVEPIHDDEDGRVVDVAIAGKAYYIITHNVKHFKNYNVVPRSGMMVMYPSAGREIGIVHPFDFAYWLRLGRIVTPQHTFLAVGTSGGGDENS